MSVFVPRNCSSSGGEGIRVCGDAHRQECLCYRDTFNREQLRLAGPARPGSALEITLLLEEFGQPRHAFAYFLG